MCGRFTLRTPPADWCQLFFPAFDFDALPPDPPRYNIAPTQRVFCLWQPSAGEPPAATSLRWGLIPPWAEDVKVGHRMINARSETVDSKRSFRQAFAHRRCLIAADGYYEWQQTAHGKQPYLIELATEQPFALAGLWEENRRAAAEGETIRSCTILTTAASPATEPIHDRMPVLLPPSQFAAWIDPGNRDTGQLKSLLRPVADGRLRLTPVSTYVNSPRHGGPECVQPVGPM